MMPEKPTYEELEQKVRELEAVGSETKRMLDLLQQKEIRYQNIFEHMLHEVHVWELVYDDNGNIKTWKLVDANPAALNTWGKNLFEIVGKTTDEIFPNSNATELFMPVVKKIFSEGKPHKWESYFPDTNQTLHMISVPIGDGFISSGFDITEHRQAEEERRKSDERFRIAMEISPDGFTILRPVRDDQDRVIDFTWVFENEAVARMNGTDPQKVVGQRLLELFPGHQGTQFFNTYKQVAETGKTITFEDKYVGETIENLTWFRIVVMPMAENIAILNQDITEGKKAEESLRKQNYLLARSQELGQIGTWELDLINNRLIWTDENCRIFGVPEGSVVDYETFLSRVHPDDREYVNREWNAGVEGKPYDIEHRLLVDGEVKWVREKADLEINDNGKAVSAIGFTQDITERKNAEREALIMRTAIDQSPVGIALADATIQIYYCNAEGLGMRGGDSHALVEIPKDAFANWQVLMLNGEPYEIDNLPLVRAISRGETVREDFIVRHQDGSNHICDAYAYPVYENGSIIGGMVIFLDVTERKRAEQRIEHLNRILRAIRDVNQLILREHDPAALIREGCRLMVDNRGYASALIILTDEENQSTTWAASGLASISDELNLMLNRKEQPPCCDLARKAMDVIVIDDHADICGNCLMASESRQSTSLCARLTHGNNSFGYLITAVDNDIGVDNEELSLFSEMAGDLAYALSYMRMGTDHEISERKRKTLEKQLFQAQKMESVGLLAGGVAHDYNNMLSIIIGYSDLAIEKVKPSDPLHDDLMEISAAAKRSTDITRQLLAFARQQTIAPKVLDLNDTIGSMLKMLRRLIGENIDLSWRPGAEVWPVKIDPTQVDQILANLCVNARDAIADVGKVTIETRNIFLDEDYCADHAGFIPGKFVLLAVSDSGCGIAPESLEKVFEPFFTTKGQGEGTGLGLATVYGIVKQNEGFINVYSEPDNGTSIKIYIPRHTGKAIDTQVEITEEIPLSLSNETVLLVEDDAAILKLGKRILEDLGYTVLPAGGPHEAIRLSEKHDGEINLLITDVVMPEMNGRELSEKLKGLYPGLKILFMSGYTANVIAHRGVLDDGINFIAKPFSKKAMAVTVREMLDIVHG